MTIAIHDTRPAAPPIADAMRHPNAAPIAAAPSEPSAKPTGKKVLQSVRASAWVRVPASRPSCAIRTGAVTMMPR